MSLYVFLAMVVVLVQGGVFVPVLDVHQPAHASQPVAHEHLGVGEDSDDDARHACHVDHVLLVEVIEGSVLVEVQDVHRPVHAMQPVVVKGWSHLKDSMREEERRGVE